MKTLKSIMLGLVLIAVCGAAKAAGNDNSEKLSKNYVINTFVDAITRGKLSGLNEVIDQNAAFNTVHGKQIESFNKQQLLDYLQANKNVEQSCTTSTALIAGNDDMAVVRVDMKYDGSVKNEYVTIVNTGNGWKITNVYAVIK